MGTIEFNYQTAFELVESTSIKHWIQKIVVLENLKIETISYVFCNDDFLVKINKQFLDHDTLTDIISFDYSGLGYISGEIYISIDRVRFNAQKYDVEFNDELERVIIHGILHLCGYKDKTQEESNQMRYKEDWALALRS